MDTLQDTLVGGLSSQPIWKICSSNWIEFPLGSGLNIKNIWAATTEYTIHLHWCRSRGTWVVHPHQTRCQSFGRSGAVQWYKAKWSGGHLGNHGKIVSKQWETILNWWLRNTVNSPVEVGRLSHHSQAFTRIMGFSNGKNTAMLVYILPAN